MSKVRNLPEITVLDDADLVYVVDASAGPNGGRKATIANLRTAVVSQAQDIPYNNNDSTLTATDVKDAIDELDDKVNAHHLRHLPDGTDPLTTAAPDTDLSPTTLNTTGSANSFARSNHTHRISTALVSDIVTIQPDASAAAGTATNFARGDHRHAIVCDAPTTTLAPSTTNAEGSGTSFARNDHTHAIGTGIVGDIVTIQPNATALAGTADRYARADHRHAIATASAASTGTTNTEGVSTSFSRADHVHNTVISNTSVTTTVDDTTTSTTDVLIVGMTTTPAAGTYMVQFGTSTVNSGNGAERNYFSIYSGGVVVSGSERSVGIGGGSYVPVNTFAIVTVNGSQAIEARWRVIAGTGTSRARTLSIIRLG